MSKERVLVVTGGGAGIGAAVVSEWVAQGGRAAVLDLGFAEIEESSSIVQVRCDVTSRDEVNLTIGQVVERFGRIDALVNGAGIMRVEPSTEMTEENARATFGVHWFGAMWAAQAALPALAATQGAIVNISSVAGISGMPNRVAYNSAKSAIDAMTRTLAVEWAPHGVRVNAVAPGYTKTRMTGDLIDTGKLHVEPITARTPLARFAEPAEIAAPVVFMLSPGASFITGQVLYVDGGLTVDGNWY